MARVIRFIIAGTIGAVIGWAIVEPIDAITPSSGVLQISYGSLVAFGLIVGLCIGLSIAIAEVFSGISAKDAGRVVTAGGIVGAAGGVLGLSFGQAFYAPVSAIAYSEATPSLVAFILLLVARSFGWALIGAFIGATPGIAFASPKQMINGGIGGLLGGGAGGAVFEILAQMNAGRAVAFHGELLRFIGLATTGAGIGLFVGLFQELFKQAWVVVLRGKNEGREFILYKDTTVLGRDELATIPVFGDTSVAPQHAQIRLENNRYSIYDLGAPFGTSVNGQKITSHVLKDGDLIELGSMRISFHEKATASKFSGYIDKQEPKQAQIPTSQHICPFCGSIKDAQGNCQCTVGGEQANSMTPTSTTAQTPFTVPEQSISQPSPTLQTPAEAKQPALIGVSGTYANQTFTLPPSEVSIGRDANKLISLAMDNTVSRSHARLAVEAGAHVIYDEGSSNGTFVNGLRIQRQVLKNGDVVQLGSTKFRFEE